MEADKTQADGTIGRHKLGEMDSRPDAMVACRIVMLS
jgi:hypothetical protein